MPFVKQFARLSDIKTNFIFPQRFVRNIQILNFKNFDACNPSCCNQEEREDGANITFL